MTLRRAALRCDATCFKPCVAVHLSAVGRKVTASVALLHGGAPGSRSE